MKAKSEENIEAADLLMESEKYNASVHCSYYAAFQYVKYVLAEMCEYKIPYKEQYVPNDVNKGSHEYVYDLLKMSINKSDIDNPSLEYEELIQILTSLKNARTTADYKEFNVSVNKCEKCITNAHKVIDKLNEIFS